MSVQYDESSIKSLEWDEHIRLRPGMYIGKLGDGSAPDDGIYILLKEVIDNCIDEFSMGFGKRVDVTLAGKTVAVRDFGRGIPLGKLEECVSRINTGAKYDSSVFKKSVGLNGVGTKAVNALSTGFRVCAVREGQKRELVFERGKLVRGDKKPVKSGDEPGTFVEFTPDARVFGEYEFRDEFIKERLQDYAFLNPGLVLTFNGERFQSKNGLLDLLTDRLGTEPLYPVVHLKGHDIEIAFTHVETYGEVCYSYVNGAYTTQGGTHLSSFREALSKTVREFYKKEFQSSDIMTGIVAAISLKVEEPVFESQTKTKLGSVDMGPNGPSIRTFVGNFIKEELDNFLHKNAEISQKLLEKVQQTERERKDLAGIQKLARERARSAKLHNKRLRDCKVHLDTKDKRREDSTIFITEGESASGSLTQSRDPDTQAVFALKGKPQNCFGMTKKICYENEELNLLQAALNIEDGIENLRYNRVVLTTDADHDGAHIRLLLLTYFLQFYPDLVSAGHLYVLQTPLFRVRNKKETIYSYSEEEKQRAIQKLGGNPEVTRFKGLGEISPKEMEGFIGSKIRLEPVLLPKHRSIPEMLSFYMGKNTPERQEFILKNLAQELDLVEA